MRADQYRISLAVMRTWLFEEGIDPPGTPAWADGRRPPVGLAGVLRLINPNDDIASRYRMEPDEMPLCPSPGRWISGVA